MKEEKINRTLVGVVLVAIMVLIAVVIIVAIGNKGKEKEVNVPEVLSPATTINKDAKPEDNPSIEGNENVTESNGLKTNTTIPTAMTVRNYKFTNIKLEATNEGTTLTAKVSANVTEKIKGQDIEIKFYDKNGKLVSIMQGYVGQIKPDVTIDFRAETTSDVSNAYKMEIEIVK